MSLEELNRRHQRIWGTRHAHHILDDDEPVATAVIDEPAIERPKPEDPCRHHPNWERLSCNICWRDPSRRNILFQEFLKQSERQELYHRTGTKVETASDARRVMAQKGLREAEKGEKAYDQFDALAEVAEGGTLDERHSFANVDLWGDRARAARRAPINLQERYEYHRQRLGLA